jgi:hypothetical protein
MSSGRMQPWAGSLVPGGTGGTGGLVAGFGVAVAEEAGGVSGGDEEVGLVAVPEDGADGGPDAGADVLGWAGERGASCRQAAMTTRLPAWSALPPTPLRSTK